MFENTSKNKESIGAVMHGYSRFVFYHFFYYGTKGMKQQAKAPLYLMCNSMYNVVTRVYVVEKNEYLCLTDFFTQSVRFI